MSRGSGASFRAGAGMAGVIGHGLRACVRPASFVGHGFTGYGKNPQTCHSEERSDEESLFFLAFRAERFLAPLGMTREGLFSESCSAVPLNAGKSMRL